MIQLVIRSRSGTKKSTPTPSVVRNPTPPKNLRLRNPVSSDIDRNAMSKFTFESFKKTKRIKYVEVENDISKI